MRNQYNTSMMREFANLANAVNRSFTASYDYDRNGGTTNPGSIMKHTFRLPVDAWSDENGFTFRAYLPGVNPADVEITYDKDDLIIRGEMKSGAPIATESEGNSEGKAENKVEMIRKELFNGKFERRFSFNTAIDIEKTEAEFENGVLTLTVPKAEEAKPKQIVVKGK